MARDGGGVLSPSALFYIFGDRLGIGEGGGPNVAISLGFMDVAVKGRSWLPDGSKLDRDQFSTALAAVALWSLRESGTLRLELQGSGNDAVVRFELATDAGGSGLEGKILNALAKPEPRDNIATLALEAATGGIPVPAYGGEQDRLANGVARANWKSKDPWNGVVDTARREAADAGYVKLPSIVLFVILCIFTFGVAALFYRWRPKRGRRDRAELEGEFAALLSDWQAFQQQEPQLHRALLEETAGGIASCYAPGSS